MKIIDVEQHSAEWLAARLGIVTASEADALVSPTYKMKEGSAPESFLNRKLAEKLTGKPISTYQSVQMECGNILEEEAIPYLEFSEGLKIGRVGFVTTDDGRAGCSPDGWESGCCGRLDNGWEIKCPMVHTHIGYLLSKEVPIEYRVQVQFSMWVTGLPCWHFVSYCRGFPALKLLVKSDPIAQKSICEAVSNFNERFDLEHSKLYTLIGGAK